MFDLNGHSEAEGSSQEDLPSGEFELLTDALRAGPGSMEWSRAIQQFGNGRGADEYNLLLEARQRLEAGKAYRALESTPGFKQAVLESISTELAWRSRAAPAPALRGRTLLAVAAIAAMVTLVVTGLVVESMLTQDTPSGAVSIYLPPPHHSRNRDPSDAGMTTFESVMPAGWQTIGSLRVVANRGLRLAGGAKLINQSGGIFWAEPLSAEKPFKVLAHLRYTGAAAVSPELFVTDDNTFDDDRPADRNHEFAWTVMNDRPQVMTADRAIAFADEPIVTGQAVAMAVEIKVDGSNASVDTNISGRCTHWSGAHLLAADKPMWMGMRFIVHGSRHDDCVSVEAIRLAAAR
jgi:hypothetical protein